MGLEVEGRQEGRPCAAAASDGNTCCCGCVCAAFNCKTSCMNLRAAVDDNLSAGRKKERGRVLVGRKQVRERVQ